MDLNVLAEIGLNDLLQNRLDSLPVGVLKSNSQDVAAAGNFNLQVLLQRRRGEILVGVGNARSKDLSRANRFNHLSRQVEALDHLNFRIDDVIPPRVRVLDLGVTGNSTGHARLDHIADKQLGLGDIQGGDHEINRGCCQEACDRKAYDLPFVPKDDVVNICQA